MYHVDLDLDENEVKQLKQFALHADIPVRGLVTMLVKEGVKVFQEQTDKQSKNSQDKKKEETEKQ